jgi:hypothetical protein
MRSADAPAHGAVDLDCFTADSKEQGVCACDVEKQSYSFIGHVLATRYLAFLAPPPLSHQFQPAQSSALQEDENSDLAVKNVQLQQRITELEALAAAAEAAAQVQQQQQRDEESPEPSTPQHQHMRMLGLCGDDASMQERATSVLKRAAAASRLSGMYQVCMQ